MEITSRANFKQTIHPQLIVLQEPVCKVAKRTNKDGSICFPEDEPEVELSIPRELNECRDPLMLSDAEDVEGATENRDTSCADEEVRQILSQSEKTITPKIDENIEFEFCDVEQEDTEAVNRHSEDRHKFVYEQKIAFSNVKNRSQSTRISKNSCKQRLQTASSSHNNVVNNHRPRNRSIRYSPSDWDSVIVYKIPNNSFKINKMKSKFIEQQRIKKEKNDKESLRRAELKKCFKKLHDILSLTRQKPLEMTTEIYLLKETKNCINNLVRREKFLIHTKRQLSKKNDALNNKLLELFEN